MSGSLALARPVHELREPKVSLGEREFQRIKAIMIAKTGITLGNDKINLVHSRLQKRMRQLGHTDFSVYCNIVESPEGGAELRYMVNALTTNLTRFFREPHHFKHLVEETLPQIVSRAKKGERIRIWSGGCSTGQEPYSIAAVLLSMMPDAPNKNVKILASDIDSNVIQTARQGSYEASIIKHMPEKLKNKFFHCTGEEHGQTYTAGPEIKSIISFRELNLNAPAWPMKGTFDIIFCRNTVIYFDEETQAKIWTRFKNQLSPGGYLYIGHSERLSGPSAKKFTKVGTTTYQLNTK